MNSKVIFPDVETATKEGIVAIGGNLEPSTLITAYSKGIFPWFCEGEPIIWWSPNPRLILFPHDLHISKSLRKLIKQNKFKVTFNQNFNEVIKNCKLTERKNQDGTWITDDMIEAYKKLFKLGYIISVEVWEENKLVGGLYGVNLGKCFFGESMFSLVSNSSKIGFVKLVEKLRNENYKLIDCQVKTKYLISLGAKEVSRKFFLKLIRCN
jgi:leucyl/phenylalanyl-tRNA--protein transferase